MKYSSRQIGEYKSWFEGKILGKDVFDSKNNNWTTIRLIAAIAVIYGHSFGMFDHKESTDWTISNISRGITYSGQMAVIVFFF